MVGHTGTGGARRATAARAVAGVLVLAFAGAGMMRVRIDRAAQGSSAESPVVYVTSGETLKKF